MIVGIFSEQCNHGLVMFLYRFFYCALTDPRDGWMNMKHSKNKQG